MDNFSAQVLTTITQNQMIPKGGAVIVGFSGGADSTALLHFLWKQSKKLGFTVAAAHLNHCLRGQESERDELFVKEWCKQRQIPLAVKRVEIQKAAAQRGCGLEECGREERYAFFQELATGPQDRIATAHTLSDNVETLLFHLLRGTGMRGLCGIPAVRGRIIRPFLQVSREQIEQYCRENQLDYRTDSSNLTREYTRNHIRLDIIPVLKQMNPSFEQSVDRTIHLMQEDEKFLSDRAAALAAEAYGEKGWSLPILSGQPAALRSRVFRILAEQAGCAHLDSVHITSAMKLLESGAGAIHLPGNIECRAGGGTLRFFPRDQWEITQWEIPLLPVRTVVTPRKIVRMELICRKEYDKRLKFNKMLFNNALDYDTITNSTVLRNRRAGDLFCQAGRGMTKTLKKLLNEKKFPSEQRDALVLIAQREHVLWLESGGVSQAAAVTERTQSVLLILPEESRDDQGDSKCSTEQREAGGNSVGAGQTD